MELFYIQLLGVMFFFISFLFFCKGTQQKLSSPSSMSLFFDSIFFIYEGGKAALIGRLSLIFLLPVTITYKYFIGGEYNYFLFLICGAWLLLLYCYKYRKDITPGRIKNSALFSELLFRWRSGFRGLFLWVIRCLYILGIYLHFS